MLRLGCDAGVIRVVEDHDGTPLSVGRKQRTIPPSMKKALVRRDQTCRYPGCCTSVFLEGHHCEHWALGGETTIGNLLLLCGYHHRFVHEYGFTIELDDSEVRFLDPSGHLVKEVPDRPRSPHLGWPMIRARNAHLNITTETPVCESTGEPVDYVACIDGLVRVEKPDGN